MSASETMTYDWNTLPWRKPEQFTIACGSPREIQTQPTVNCSSILLYRKPRKCRLQYPFFDSGRGL